MSERCEALGAGGERCLLDAGHKGPHAATTTFESMQEGADSVYACVAVSQLHSPSRGSRRGYYCEGCDTEVWLDKKAYKTIIFQHEQAGRKAPKIMCLRCTAQLTETTERQLLELKHERLP